MEINMAKLVDTTGLQYIITRLKNTYIPFDNIVNDNEYVMIDKIMSFSDGNNKVGIGIGNGQLKVNEEHVATKEYVDDLLGDIANILDSI